MAEVVYTVDRGGIYSQVSIVNSRLEINTNLICIFRSLIASYIGNIVGALFVGLPAVYLYLKDYQFTDTEMKELESGDHRKEDPPYNPKGDSTTNNIKEVYESEGQQS